MVSIYELKLGNETLEALKFLLSQVEELEEAIKAINLEEVKSISVTIQSNKDAVESAKVEIEQIKTALNNDKLDFDSKYVIFKEFSATIEPLKTLLNKIKQDVEQNAQQVATNTNLSTQNKEEIKQKYNEIQELARDVKADYEKSKENLTNSNFVKDEVIQKDNELREFVETKNNEIIAYTDKKKEDFNQYMEDKNEELEAWIEQKFGNVDTTKQEIISAKEQVRSDKEKTHAFKEQVEQKAKELISLESALSTLKEQIQETIKTGSINDDTLSSTQSYSSNKVEQDFLKKETAEQTYLKKTDTIDAYTKTQTDKTFVKTTNVYTKEESDGKYASSSVLTDYLTTENANKTYASKSELNNKLDVDTYNNEKNDFATKSDISSVKSAIPNVSEFITQNTADSRYIRSENANYTTVTDNLASSSPKEALSANQGKVLKELIDKKIDKTSAEFLYLKKAGQTAFDKREQTSLSVDLRQSNNFVINPNTKETLSLNNGIVGQTGIVVVIDSSKISGFGSMCKFKVAPKELYGYDLFIYFVVSPTDVKMAHMTVGSSNSVESKVQRFQGTYFPLTHTTKDPVYPKYVERGGATYTFKPNDGLYFSKPPVSFKFLLKNDPSANNSLYFNDPDINFWSMSQIDNTAGMFHGCKNFNQNLNNFNIENVKDANSMFWDCHKFNQPLAHFKTKKASDLSFMLYNCKNFNQNIANLDVTNVTNYKFFAQGSGLAKANAPLKFRNKTANTTW
ncbi:BspA family leucine-rich repeat surface protein [Campylobacter pinnipediorum]|uniref:BspA family leucine-rich repeat surface protein n=1 Tax=Campylobacter pinnipediorum TaxID=1965231 RepID=UPI000994DC1F|nr:BspA family leucine-rich repeat surface protein [Campylobacter pinnipediorum]AQW82991.1 putative DUF285 domain protein [Campylobacter pinnipediorum subsp. pinnipediorum]